VIVTGAEVLALGRSVSVVTGSDVAPWATADASTGARLVPPLR